MISRIRGLLLEKEPTALVVDVGGLGYELEVPLSTFVVLPECGAEVALFTHLVVREDALLLHGFATRAERTLFRELLRVNGVGARLASAILSGMNVAELVDTIHEGEVGRLTKISGVGRKTAERLVVELRDRVADWSLPTAASTLAPGGQMAQDEAVSALLALGYKQSEARRVLEQLETASLSSEEIIRLALQHLGRVAG
ncbi:MAG: Holliday junction branch migration protein RuvA [Gammaproteobacteria bacterium]|nr:Holliday junction branch migration protein RuvA [Gammaproteobacteria bacterium]